MCLLVLDDAQKPHRRPRIAHRSGYHTGFSYCITNLRHAAVNTGQNPQPVEDQSLGIWRPIKPLQSSWPPGAVALCTRPRCATQTLYVKNVCPIAPGIARLADRQQHGKLNSFRDLDVSVGYYEPHYTLWRVSA